MKDKFLYYIVNMNKSITLIISGSIAAYKSLELIRRLREQGTLIRPVMTRSAKQFVTPLSVAALAEHPVYEKLFDLKDETEMGHIRLSRESDAIVVAPATADLIAKMAHGLADDLASSILLASDKPILVAPAMNMQMWEHPATQRNIKQIQEDGATLMTPESGQLACGETGQGRMADLDNIISKIKGMA